ncbi:hypothetical protein GCM10027043_52750 [Ferruginibacter profundus]
MIRPLVILTIFLSLNSCDRPQKKPEQKKVDRPKQIDMLEPDLDTLPNGKRLLDNMDSGMVHYYKEVVGSDTLKGGYITCYGIDDSTKYFYLRHGDTLHLLNQGSILASTWGLGTLEKDFTTFFMISIDNGNGCPSSYQIFDKRTGKNILGDKVEADSYAYLQDTLFMLYDSWNQHKRTNNITLFNVRTKKKEFYELPDHLPDFCDIQIGKLSTKSLTVTFESYVGDNFERTKTYRR